MPKKKTEAVVETAETKQDGQKITCGLAVVLLESGDISVQFLGDNQNLITLDGLLRYAERYLDKTWQPRIADTL